MKRGCSKIKTDFYTDTLIQNAHPYGFSREHKGLHGWAIHGFGASQQVVFLQNKAITGKIMSFSYVRASSEELAIGASCLSLTNTVSDFLLFTSKHRLMGVYRTFWF